MTLLAYTLAEQTRYDLGFAPSGQGMTTIPRYSPTTIEIKQFPRPTRTADFDDAEGAIVVCDSERLLAPAGHFPYFDVLKQQLIRRYGEARATSPRSLDLPNKRCTRITVFGFKSTLTPYALLTLYRTAIAAQLEHNPRVLTLCIIDLDPELAARVITALAAGLYAATYSLPSFKSKPEKPKRLAYVTAVGLHSAVDLRRVIAVAHGNNLARHLTVQPPNRLTPRTYREQISALARTQGWKMTFHDVKRLRKVKAGAFLAVAQGNSHHDAGIVQLEYRPRRQRTPKPWVTLVGKGICFDTGGTNLKPAKSMLGMHEDMQGSAVALGTLWALTELAYPHPVDCWLPLTENMIGPAAYKQNDVVTASNGTTIEIIHTDAEGRLILADALALANRTHPRLIIDFATLTGSCIGALGTRYSGVFTNRPVWHNELIAAGERSGERVWPFPCDDDYDEALTSRIADVKQCTLENDADHILATMFLKRFVGQTPWIHLDLAAGNHTGGLAHIPTDVTGFGVGFSVEFLDCRDPLAALESAPIKNRASKVDKKPQRSRRKKGL
jgi:leucyl aminopeptidase